MLQQVTAAAISVMLAFALSPADTTAGTTTDDSTTTVVKPTTYVLKSVTSAKSNGFMVNLYKGTFKYNKKQLLKQYKPTGSKAMKYTYTTDNRLKTIKQSKAKTTFTTTAAGVLKKAVYSTGSGKAANTYKRSGSKVKSYKSKQSSGTTKYTLKYSKGRVVSETIKPGSLKRALTCAYDKRGNLTQWVYTYYFSTGSVSITVNIKNKYDKNGNLKKRTVSSPGSSAKAVYKYTYEKVEVADKAMKKLVDAQQWALANKNLNFAVGAGPDLLL